MASSKNIGDQIFNAVQNAVDSQDLRNLQSTIEKSIGIAAESIANLDHLVQAGSIRRVTDASGVARYYPE